MSEVMTFRGKYAFLSNMHSVDFEWDGRIYHSSEAAFQSAKSRDPEVRDSFSGMTGVVAKREGKKVNLRGDWESVKVDIMEDIVRAKFSQNPDLAKKLIETGDMELVEGNRWHDTFWGVDAVTGKGENNLGIILMKIREELGGEDYLITIERMRREREEARRQARACVQAEIDALQAEIDALPIHEFTGKEFTTRAFGRVMITRQEDNYLFFEAAGKEKKFALPGCIVQGFLVPGDPGVVEGFRRQQELEQQIAELLKKLKEIR